MSLGVNRYTVSHGGKFPNSIVIYRNGCGEGQYEFVILIQLFHKIHLIFSLKVLVFTD